MYIPEWCSNRRRPHHPFRRTVLRLSWRGSLFSPRRCCLQNTSNSLCTLLPLPRVITFRRRLSTHSLLLYYTIGSPYRCLRRPLPLQVPFLLYFGEAKTPPPFIDHLPSPVSRLVLTEASSPLYWVSSFLFILLHNTIMEE